MRLFLLSYAVILGVVMPWVPFWIVPVIIERAARKRAASFFIDK